MSSALWHLTELVKLPVYDTRGRAIGRIRDAAIVPVIDPARIDRYFIGAPATMFSFRHDQVRSISLDGIHLSDEQLMPYHADEYMLRLVRDLLDQQIIDSKGRKVVRVTDVSFDTRTTQGRDQLFVATIDVGMRSVFRRVFQGALPRTWIRKLQTAIPPRSIHWALTDILEPDPQRRIRLNITYRRLKHIHPADLADIVEELSPDGREAIFETLDSDVAAEVLGEVEPELQASILESLETEKAAEILDEMSPNQAADLLGELEEEKSAVLLQEMEDEPKEDVEELMEFDEDTAGGMMNTEYVAVPEHALVEDALAALRQNEELLDQVNVILLTGEGDTLKGIVPVARLFVSNAQKPLRGLAFEETISAPVEAKEAEVTELFDKYNLLTLAVVREDGAIAGVITADDVISVLRQK